MNTESCNAIIVRLNEDLDFLKSESMNPLTMCEAAMGLCTLAMIELKKLVYEQGFSTHFEEIHFFKVIKPKVLSKLLFYNKLLAIEGKRPKIASLEEGYLREVLLEHHKFFERNQLIYQYYWKKESYLDEHYFLRTEGKFPVLFEFVIGCSDPEFSTEHDFTFSCFIAYEHLIKYLENEISKLQLQNTLPGAFFRPAMKWTGYKIDLVEMAYGLHSTGYINNGNIDIKVIIEAFSKLFNIELDDFYRTYQDIRARKTERIKFLDKMKQSLQNRLDESDA
jgi:hypothetical protein